MKDFTVIRLKRMRWEGHIARTGEKFHIGFWYGEPKERDSFEEQGIYGRIIIK